jgi:predicted methyltransferase
MIAEQLPEVRFYTYTHRSDIIDNNTYKILPKNLVINTSDFKRKGLNQFKAVKIKSKFVSYSGKAQQIVKELKLQSKSNFNCRGDCSKCSLCKFNHNKDIYVAYH